MDFISSQTCVLFEEKNVEPYIEVVHGDDGECSSYIGLSGDVGGVLTLSDRCDKSMTHELLHSLGIRHMQMRTDRDQNVVYSGKNDRNNKIAMNSSIVTPYEYGSVLHYPTMSNLYPMDQEFNYTMGNRQLTFYDVTMVNQLYNCTCENDLKCENDGYTNPRNCEECICPDGFFGTLCDKYDDKPLQSTTEWQVLRQSVNDQTIYQYIRPMENSTLEITYDYFQLTNQEPGCKNGNLEIKYLPDRRITNPFICSTEQMLGETIYSTNDPTIIVFRSYEQDFWLEFEVSYRSVKN